MVDVNKQTLMHVKDRVLKACQVKQNDDDKTFYRWLCGNGFYKSIGKKALSPGGEFPIDCVRSAMTHLGWEATRHWSRYINAFSSMLSSMMPELTKNERRWFDGCYCAHRAFGNFTLAELFGMLPGLPLILSLLWQNPYDRQRLQMLPQMLFYYSQMVHLRRLADRTSKRKQARTQITIESELHPASLNDNISQIDLRDSVRKLVGTCPHRRCWQSLVLVETTKNHDGSIVISRHCEVHGELSPNVVTAKEIAELIKEFDNSN